MKITVLGCSGAEFPGSNAPAFFLNDEILFDAGSLTNVLDEKAQMRINYIFITHAHLRRSLTISKTVCARGVADEERAKVVGGNRRRHSRNGAGGEEIGCRAAPLGTSFVV